MAGSSESKIWPVVTLSQMLLPSRMPPVLPFYHWGGSRYKTEEIMEPIHIGCYSLTMNIVLEHVAIPSPDPAALKDWYELVLGAREIFNNGQTPPTCLLALPGGGWFEIYAAEAAPENRGNNKLAGFRHLALRVDSINEAKAELERRGVRFSEVIRPAAGGGSVLFFADCEGNLLHLVERPKKEGHFSIKFPI